MHKQYYDSRPCINDFFDRGYGELGPSDGEARQLEEKRSRIKQNTHRLDQFNPDNHFDIKDQISFNFGEDQVQANKYVYEAPMFRKFERTNTKKQEPTAGHFVLSVEHEPFRGIKNLSVNVPKQLQSSGVINIPHRYVVDVSKVGPVWVIKMELNLNWLTKSNQRALRNAAAHELKRLANVLES